MSRRGFTLIELMIIVAIIGILTAIVVPKIQELMARHKTNSINHSYTVSH